jgi:hypothetical protein
MISWILGIDSDCMNGSYWEKGPIRMDSLHHGGALVEEVYVRTVLMERYPTSFFVPVCIWAPSYVY